MKKRKEKKKKTYKCIYSVSRQEDKLCHLAFNYRTVIIALSVPWSNL